MEALVNTLTLSKFTEYDFLCSDLAEWSSPVTIQIIICTELFADIIITCMGRFLLVVLS